MNKRKSPEVSPEKSSAPHIVATRPNVVHIPEPPEYREGWDYAKEPADLFVIKKQFNTRAEFLVKPSNTPKVFITQKALLKMLIIISAIELEVGWLGTAKRDGENFIIEDVFLFRQDVSSGHTELHTESMSDFVQEILTLPDGMDIANNIMFWGHSHGSGGTYPSQQDNETMKIFRDFNAEFFIRAILNRRGELSASVYDWKKGIAYHEVTWELTGPGIKQSAFEEWEKSIRAEMKEKVIYRYRVYKAPYRFMKWKKGKFPFFTAGTQTNDNPLDL